MSMFFFGARADNATTTSTQQDFEIVAQKLSMFIHPPTTEDEMVRRFFQQLLLVRLISTSTGFLFRSVERRQCSVTPRPWLAAPTASSSSALNELTEQIEARILARKDPEELLQKLEALNTIQEPNRSPSFLQEWNVWYTNCPPPSNGQLGPFRGTAGQVIQDATTHSYQNLLKVPPNNWLTATLDGVWEEWDGKILSSPDVDAAAASEKHRASRTNDDWGANHWKVTFKRLRIALFGFTLVNKEFPPGTARIWRTTYLDDDIRVVRAGKTGRIEDEVVFYTKRKPAPTELLK